MWSKGLASARIPATVTAVGMVGGRFRPMSSSRCDVEAAAGCRPMSSNECGAKDDRDTKDEDIRSMATGAEAAAVMQDASGRPTSADYTVTRRDGS